MILSIILALLRSGLKVAGGALVSDAVSIVNGLPAVHNIEQAATGVALAACGVVASMAHTVKAAKASGKLKVESGPIYKTNK